ncbi:MAG: Rrf2 family transcriptional regulator [Clostridiales bacterium]|nr:Rrf2 family transcriptional regulator [Clostridiales bacterium]MBQ2816497.1 Rrf2 family transcriptional regulator [Clostridia bacterium]
MKLSTKSRYGIRAMLELALVEGDSPIAISSIAQKQNIPEPYLEQLMGTLKKHDLVISTRGAQGGYRLSKPGEMISIGDIIRALEGSMAPVACVEDGDFCAHSGSCAMHMLYGRITRGINDVFDSITLADMADDQRSMDSRACSCKG